MKVFLKILSFDVLYEICTFLSFDELNSMRLSFKFFNEFIINKSIHFNTKYIYFKHRLNMVRNLHLTCYHPLLNQLPNPLDKIFITCYKEKLLETLLKSNAYDPLKTIIETNDLRNVKTILRYHATRLILNGVKGDTKTDVKLEALKRLEFRNCENLDWFLTTQSLALIDSIVFNRITFRKDVEMRCNNNEIAFKNCMIQGQIKICDNIEKLCIINCGMVKNILVEDGVSDLILNNCSDLPSVKLVNNLKIVRVDLDPQSINTIIEDMKSMVITNKIDIGIFKEECDKIYCRRNLKFIFYKCCPLTIQLTVFT